MASHRCGGTRIVRDNPDRKLGWLCPGCPDCARCHGSHQMYRFEPCMVDAKQGCYGGLLLFTLQIDACPGCIDCKLSPAQVEV